MTSWCLEDKAADIPRYPMATKKRNNVAGNFQQEHQVLEVFEPKKLNILVNETVESLHGSRGQLFKASLAERAR